jgi:hypothetical protein
VDQEKLLGRAGSIFLVLERISFNQARYAQTGSHGLITEMACTFDRSHDYPTKHVVFGHHTLGEPLSSGSSVRLENNNKLNIRDVHRLAPIRVTNKTERTEVCITSS